MTFLYLLSSPQSRIDFQEEQDKTVLYNSAKETFASSNASPLINILKKATNKDRKERPKIDEIRKEIANFKETLSEKRTVVFGITPQFQQKILSQYNLSNQSVKLNKHLELELKADSGCLYIKKSRKQEKENRLTVEIFIESSSKVYYGFINYDDPTEIVLLGQPPFFKVKDEIIAENGVYIQVEPTVKIDRFTPIIKKDLTDLVNLILEKEEEVKHEIEDNKSLALTFEQWKSVLDLEKQLIGDRKQVFKYQSKFYDRKRQIVTLTLQDPISVEQFDQITSPPLPVTISVKISNRSKIKQLAIGDIIDGERGSQNELIEKLHISIGDFCDPELIESIEKTGKIETNFKAQESEISRRNKALREIRYGDSENTELSKVIVSPANVKQIEPLMIRKFFNEKLDESQQRAVCKALATEDIFLIQGPPGTGKTSVITQKC